MKEGRRSKLFFTSVAPCSLRRKSAFFLTLTNSFFFFSEENEGRVFTVVSSELKRIIQRWEFSSLPEAVVAAASEANKTEGSRTEVDHVVSSHCGGELWRTIKARATWHDAAIKCRSTARKLVIAAASWRGENKEAEPQQWGVFSVQDERMLPWWDIVSDTKASSNAALAAWDRRDASCHIDSLMCVINEYFGQIWSNLAKCTIMSLIITDQLCLCLEVTSTFMTSKTPRKNTEEKKNTLKLINSICCSSTLNKQIVGVKTSVT